jgi:hypothetical protein
MAHEWIVERTTHARFPFRIRIEGAGKTLLAVRAQSAWPGAGNQIFCLRETQAPAAGESLEPLERVPVAHLARLGRKLSVTLDRGTRKRCEFLKIEVKDAGGAGVREQIFFRTQAAAREHRSSGRIEVWPAESYDVVVDAAERYPWRFPGATLTRRRLPVGDYALLDGERLSAVVERKTLENLLTDVTRLRSLHQQLTELSSYAHAALVVEARYDDFADPARVRAWQPTHLLRVLAELQVLHPRLPIVYAGSRRSANVWAQRFFAAVAGHVAQPGVGLAEQALPLFHDAQADGGLDVRIREAVLASEAGVTLVALAEQFPSAPKERLSRVLKALRAEGRVACHGRGVTARWREVESAGKAGGPTDADG